MRIKVSLRTQQTDFVSLKDFTVNVSEAPLNLEKCL